MVLIKILSPYVHIYTHRAKTAVHLKSIERLRAAGEVGSSLAAHVEIWADGGLAEALGWLGDELRFVLITSGAHFGPLAEAPREAERITLDDGEIALEVRSAAGEKCVRCWHRREDVGAHPAHPELCDRCITNVDGPGETRQVA